MTIGQIKKLYIVQILRILERYSDQDHPLTQKDIIYYMKIDYGVECERKAVGRNIDNLKDMGYDIEYDKGYFLQEREFEESELRYLIDSILASRYVPKKHARDLIQKLTKQSNVYFESKLKHIRNIANMDHQESNELFYTIDVLSEAIADNRQVLFFYRRYNMEKKLENTSKEKRLVNPYQILIANGKYYLLGNINKYDNVTHFRLEKITGIELTESRRKPSSEVKELKNGLDLPTHMLEHVYMFDGPSVLVTMKANKASIGDIVDWLGKDVNILSQDEDSFTASVKVNEHAMKYWALQFGEKVEILKPESLRNSIAEVTELMAEKYRKPRVAEG